MNDTAMVENLLYTAPGKNGSEALSGMGGIVLGWNRGRALTLKRELRAACKTFCAAEQFW